MRILTDIIMLGFAIVTSVYDIKRRTIPVNILMAYSGAAILCSFSHIRVGGALVGGCFFLVSKLTREAVGYGDCWIITLFGIYLGIKNLIRLLFAASFLAAVASLVWMWKHGWKKEGSLPFVPFLTVGLLEVILL